MSSNEAATTEPSNEYVFGPWIECVGTHPHFAIGTHYQCGDSDGRGLPIERVASVRDQVTPYGPAARHARRAYKVGEWHPHDGNDEYPIERGTPVRVRWVSGSEVDVVASGNWGNVTAFCPLASANTASEGLRDQLFDLLRFGVNANEAHKAVDFILEKIRSCILINEARTIIRDLLEAGSMPSMYSAQMVEAEGRARAFLGDT